MDELTTARIRQAGRGRDAESPLGIPWGGWKDILWRVYRGIGQDRVMLTAAGVTFYLVLALVPTLTAFVSLYGLFNDPTSVVSQISLLEGILPRAALLLFEDQLTRLTSRPPETLGITLILSLAIALWSASAGVKALFEAMNVAYNEAERRNFFLISIMGVLFTLAGALVALLVTGAVIVMPATLALLPLGPAAEMLVRVSTYAVLLLALAMGISSLYRWGPCRTAAKWRWLAPGVILAVVLLGGTSVLFSWYLTNVSDYEAAYGSLGAIIAVLTWLWISVTVVILGAELNSEIEHQTGRDTTTGKNRPIGKRGAYMADHVGRVWPPERGRLEPVKAKSNWSRKISWDAVALAVPAALMVAIIDRRKRRRDRDN